MMKRKYSVIVPVYNVEKYINECLSSLINQTYKNIEIVVINDGSSDNSLSLIEEYSRIDDRIRVIDQKNMVRKWVHRIISVILKSWVSR